MINDAKHGGVCLFITGVAPRRSHSKEKKNYAQDNNTGKRMSVCLNDALLIVVFIQPDGADDCPSRG